MARISIKKAVSSIQQTAEIKNKHIGSNFDDFLKEEGILKKVQAGAIKKVVAFQKTMKQKHLMT